MIERMVRHHNIISIVGNIVTVDVANSAGKQDISPKFGDLARIEDGNGADSLAQVIKIDANHVSLQVFSGTQGISTTASVRFLGYPMRATYSTNILGRIFNGTGQPIDIDGGQQRNWSPTHSARFQDLNSI